MNLLRTAQAGTLESSDVMVQIQPESPNSGTIIEIQSIVQAQYGDQIEATVKKFLQQAKVTDLRVFIQDRGALDYVLKSRLQTALFRASKE
ncbi:MAG: citrate lyase acyl carrier protein [Sporomusaceae bacterium]|nr:citrate lyase acyl carrier protein [Sporomusaceae bacterium]